MKVRFTALSISSTHMKMMIALRRVRTPTTPMTNRAADRASDSASMAVLPSAEHHRPGYRYEQQHARQLEGQQIFLEQRSRHGANRAVLRHLGDRKAARNFVPRCDVATPDHHDLGDQNDSDGGSAQRCPSASAVCDLRRMTKVEKHDHEEEDHHDRAGVDEHLHDADEL